MPSSLILSGAAGSGKSRWIKERADADQRYLQRWNCRQDRTLREGRSRLHNWIRSREPTLVWLEGADDLTQEAQAFLRRILETASSAVLCVLEVREAWKLADPILSRCEMVEMPSLDKSYRRQQIENVCPPCESVIPEKPRSFQEWKETMRLIRHEAGDPYEILGAWGASLENLAAIGAGRSAWIQLALCGFSKE